MKASIQTLPLKIIAAVIIFGALNLFCFSNSFAALNGNYTINPGASASSTNYQSWASALNDLKLGTRSDGGPVQGPGVSGVVNFSVAAGTYTNQIDIPVIQGTSSSNTITFDGGNPSTCIILANSTAYPKYAVLRFDTCRFITVKNFTITSTVTADVNNSYAVQFLGTIGSSCNNNSLVNCIINTAYQPYISSSLSDEMIYGILFNGSALTNTQNGYFQNNTISGCTINNGYYGIYGVGTLDSASGNVINNCTLTNYYGAGLYMNNMNGLKITDNTLASNHRSSKWIYGIYYNAGMIISNCGASATGFTDISQNKINTFYQFGITMSGCAGKNGLRTRVSNNFILKGFANEGSARRIFCLFFNTSDSTDILNNSFSMNYPVTSFVSGNAAAFYEDGQSNNINVSNNIFSYSATTGNATPFYSPGTISRYVSFDYNIFYNADSAKTGYINSTQYSTANVGGLNAHSYVANPNFKSLADLHLQNYYSGKQGFNFGITTDIDGETRGTPPLIGADDFPSLSNNDLSISSVTAPVFPVNTGTQSISVQVTNAGNNTVSSATIYYSLNAAVPVSQAWTGSLSQGASAPFTFTTQGNFVAGLNTLKVFVSKPNGSNDSYHGNDTAMVSLYTTLSGVYTINPSSPASATNFSSFNSSANALNNGLVTGAVTINVSPGTYNEQIELDPINGSSATHTIKFDGQDTSKAILAWNGTYGSQCNINLKGCRYVTFTRLKIEGQSPDYAWPVHFYSDSTNYNRITNCVITVPTVTDNLNEAPVTFGESNGFVIPYTFPEIDVKYNEIDSCVIRGGTTSIYFSGGSAAGIDTINLVNNKFIGNTITNFYTWGIYLLTANGSKVLNNRIAPGTVTAGGIVIYSSQDSYNDFIDVSGNVITNFGSDLYAHSGVVLGGLLLSGCTAGGAGHIRVSNNMIGSLIKNSSCLYMSSCSNVDVVFNSFNYSIDGAPIFNDAAVFDYSTGINTFKNNIMAVTAETGSATCFFEADDTGKFSLANFDNNIFYNSANNNSAYIDGVMYSPANIVGAGGFNTHSYTMNPTFISAANLHITSQSNLGISFTGITTDIDNQTRAAKPCIGADEINNGCTAPAIAGLINGDTLICQGQTGVSFSVPPISGATNYVWTFPNGATIVSGSNNNNLTVDFSASALEGAVTVKGTNACGSGSVSLPLVLNVNAAPLLTYTATDVSCNGNCNGVALVNVEGSGNYKYNWSNADTTGGISGLCPGNYGVTVTDGSGCSAAVSGVINNQPLLTVSTGKADDSCMDCHNATAFVTGNGGTQPYTYAWSNGETTRAVSGLEAGVYTVCVTDAHGCVACDSVVIGSITGVMTLNGGKGIMVFPNPNNGLFTIKPGENNERLEAELFTITGEKIVDEIISTDSNYTFNLSQYGKGVYLLQITSNTGVQRQKIVVQ